MPTRWEFSRDQQSTEISETVLAETTLKTSEIIVCEVNKKLDMRIKEFTDNANRAVDEKFSLFLKKAEEKFNEFDALRDLLPASETVDDKVVLLQKQTFEKFNEFDGLRGILAATATKTSALEKRISREQTAMHEHKTEANDAIEKLQKSCLANSSSRKLIEQFAKLACNNAKLLLPTSRTSRRHRMSSCTLATRLPQTSPSTLWPRSTTCKPTSPR